MLVDLSNSVTVITRVEGAPKMIAHVYILDRALEGKHRMLITHLTRQG